MLFRLKDVAAGTRDHLPYDGVEAIQNRNSTYAVPGLGGWLDDHHLTLSDAESITGVSRAHLSRLRSGKRRASLGTVLLLSQTLQVRLDDLLTEPDSDVSAAAEPSDAEEP